MNHDADFFAEDVGGWLGLVFPLATGATLSKWKGRGDCWYMRNRWAILSG